MRHARRSAARGRVPVNKQHGMPSRVSLGAQPRDLLGDALDLAHPRARGGGQALEDSAPTARSHACSRTRARATRVVREGVVPDVPNAQSAALLQRPASAGWDLPERAQATAASVGRVGVAGSREQPDGVRIDIGTRPRVRLASSAASCAASRNARFSVTVVKRAHGAASVASARARSAAVVEVGGGRAQVAERGLRRVGSFRRCHASAQRSRRGRGRTPRGSRISSMTTSGVIGAVQRRDPESFSVTLARRSAARPCACSSARKKRMPRPSSSSPSERAGGWPARSRAPTPPHRRRPRGDARAIRGPLGRRPARGAARPRGADAAARARESPGRSRCARARGGSRADRREVGASNPAAIASERPCHYGGSSRPATRRRPARVGARRPPRNDLQCRRPCRG